MTRQVRVGDVLIGGGAPISIQSMTNVDSGNEAALLRQIAELNNAGCDIVRIAIPNMEACETLKRVRTKVKTPLVADIHFDYKLAIEAMKAGADKIRINPGNIGDIDRIKQVVDFAKEREIPIRVGVNSGSLEKEILAKYGKVTARGLAESALKNIKIIEDMDYGNLVVSIKSSDVKMTYEAHKILSKMTDVPMHIGITEAGTPKRGMVKSAVGLGALLLEGIGDTMRVSLTGDPVLEVKHGIEILRALDLRKSMIDLVSCPTCGRTKINLQALAEEVEERVAPLEAELARRGKEGIRLAVMGCAVNGPGEAREADFGIAGGDGRGLIFKKGEIIKTVKEEELADELLKVVKDYVYK